ncbi:MAG TPA: class I SAM-dependent methyltransferase [Chloroflexia bacterium]|nr:class I SAM-dependent methyltransferase [Chloroflexia bacterium]
MPGSFRDYYDKEWRIKLERKEYKTLERRWRSRWDFARKHITDNSMVLDAACGDGVLGMFLTQKQQCKVHGLDVSPYAIEIARERGVDAQLCDISGDSFPYSDEHFDAVTMLCCLEHVLDPVHAMREARRVTKVGGIIIVTLPNAVYFWNRLWFLLGKTSPDLLHINPGEGMHIQFFNYTNDFENRVLSQVEGLTTHMKRADLKNPKKYSRLTRGALYLLMKISPNLFAQYTHWILAKGAG